MFWAMMTISTEESRSYEQNSSLIGPMDAHTENAQMGKLDMTYFLTHRQKNLAICEDIATHSKLLVN